MTGFILDSDSFEYSDDVMMVRLKSSELRNMGAGLIEGDDWLVELELFADVDSRADTVKAYSRLFTRLSGKDLLARGLLGPEFAELARMSNSEDFAGEVERRMGAEFANNEKMYSAGEVLSFVDEVLSVVDDVDLPPGESGCGGVSAEVGRTLKKTADELYFAETLTNLKGGRAAISRLVTGSAFVLYGSLRTTANPTDFAFLSLHCVPGADNTLRVTQLVLGHFNIDGGAPCIVSSTSLEAPGDSEILHPAYEIETLRRPLNSMKELAKMVDFTGELEVLTGDNLQEERYLGFDFFHQLKSVFERGDARCYVEFNAQVHCVGVRETIEPDDPGYVDIMYTSKIKPIGINSDDHGHYGPGVCDSSKEKLRDQLTRHKQTLYHFVASKPNLAELLEKNFEFLKPEKDLSDAAPYSLMLLHNALKELEDEDGQVSDCKEMTQALNSVLLEMFGFALRVVIVSQSGERIWREVKNIPSPAKCEVVLEIKVELEKKLTMVFSQIYPGSVLTEDHHVKRISDVFERKYPFAWDSVTNVQILRDSIVNDATLELLNGFDMTQYPEPDIEDWVCIDHELYVFLGGCPNGISTLNAIKAIERRLSRHGGERASPGLTPFLESSHVKLYYKRQSGIHDVKVEFTVEPCVSERF